MKTFYSSADSDSRTFDLAPVEPDAPPGERFFVRWMRRCGRAAIFVPLAIIVLRLGIAVFFQHEIAGAAGDFSRVAGLDTRLAHWLEGLVSWGAAFGLVSLGWRLLGAVLWPFTRAAVQWKTIVTLLTLTGVGASIPAAVQALRGVDAKGLPKRMSEISDATNLEWFAPDGTARLTFSRESDGRLRLWNRPGCTPDRAQTAAPVTAQIRAEWERARRTAAENEARRQAAEHEAAVREKERRAASERAASERAAAERAAAERQRLERARAVAEEQRRLETVKAAEAQREAARLKDQLAALRREIESRRESARNAPEPPRSPPLTLAEKSLAASRTVQPIAKTSVPSQSIASQAPTLPPTVRTFTLRPDLELRAPTFDRPCTVWADVETVIFPNHPTAPREILRPGRTLAFPRKQGAGSRSLFARPLGAAGTLWIRFDD
jgi:hypothetical protein